MHLLCLFLSVQPNLQTRAQKEGSESEQFWELLGGKTEYRSQKITKEPESDPHLFSCSFTKGTEDHICFHKLFKPKLIYAHNDSVSFSFQTF